MLSPAQRAQRYASALVSATLREQRLVIHAYQAGWRAGQIAAASQCHCEQCVTGNSRTADA